jgi:hypothetical protein
LVSENYYDSAFCLCETGGAWYGEKPFIPILTPPVDYKDLRGALYGKQASLLNSPTDLNEIYDQVQKHLGGKDHGVARWEIRRDKFLAGIPMLLNAIGKPTGLKAAEAAALRRDRDKWKEAYSDLDTELQVAKEQIAALERAKDSDDVKRIKREFSGEDEAFEAAVQAASHALKSLTPLVRLAVYYYYRDESLPSEETEGRACDSAIEDKFLYADSDQGVRLLETHSKVRKALAATEDLRSFMSDIDGDSESAFRQDYEDRTEDVFDLTNRSFWHENKLL